MPRWWMAAVRSPRCAGSSCQRSCRGSSRSGLFAFLAAWNDFFAPLILISDPSQAPLPLAIATLRQQTMGAIDYGATEAGVVVMALPCVVLFLVLQRYYVRGFMSGAVKG